MIQNSKKYLAGDTHASRRRKIKINLNSLSTGVVRVKNATIAVNNKVTRVRSLLVGGTRRNNKKEGFKLRKLFDASISASYVGPRLVSINQ